MKNKYFYIVFMVVSALFSCSDKVKNLSSLKRFEQIKTSIKGQNCRLQGYCLIWRGGVSVLTYFNNERVENCYRLKFVRDSLKLQGKLFDVVATGQDEMDCICYYSDIVNKYQVKSIEFSLDSIKWEFIDTTFYTQVVESKNVPRTL